MSRSDAARLLRNPVAADTASLERGREAYHSYCAMCHGTDGRGDGVLAPKLAVQPPNLISAAARSTDGYLYATIRDGGPIMPSQRERISPQERWDIVNHLRSLAPAVSEITEAAPGATPASPSSTLPQADARPQPAASQLSTGDAARGRIVFEAHCQICHVADSREQLIGPGLQGLFQWPSDTLSDGTPHDAHTIDVIRRQIVEGGGSMAPVGAALSDQEIADLLAYLQTL
jgi:mono/diheme cytochrome c family protein